MTHNLLSTNKLFTKTQQNTHKKQQNNIEILAKAKNHLFAKRSLRRL